MQHPEVFAVAPRTIARRGFPSGDRTWRVYGQKLAATSQTRSIEVADPINWLVELCRYLYNLPQREAALGLWRVPVPSMGCRYRVVLPPCATILNATRSNRNATVRAYAHHERRTVLGPDTARDRVVS